MSKMNSKLILAGVLVACTFGGIALGSAWATASSGLITTIISGPTPLGEVDVKSESGINEVEIKTQGVSDVYVVRNKIVPGGAHRLALAPRPLHHLGGVRAGDRVSRRGSRRRRPPHRHCVRGRRGRPRAHRRESRKHRPGVGRLPDSSARRAAADRPTRTLGPLRFRLSKKRRPAGSLPLSKPRRPKTPPPPATTRVDWFGSSTSRSRAASRPGASNPRPCSLERN